MKKIKIELTTGKLKAICEILGSIKAEGGPSREQRAKRNILEQIGKKLFKKQIDKAYADAPFKVELHFYEADVLEKILLSGINNVPSEKYGQWQVQMVINDLNQKLA